jgi:hypothetical protein
MPNYEFGDALKQIWNTLKGLEGKSANFIKDELFYEMKARSLLPKRSEEQESNPLDHWSKGNVPGNLHVVDFLAEVGVQRAKLPPEWLEQFLRSAGYSELLRRERVRILYGPRRPLTLPARWGAFLGRRAELKQVLEALTSSWPACLIEGMGGMGKTTLVLEVAYACAQQPRGEATQFTWPKFDTIIWCSALGRELTLSDVLDSIAHHLGYPVLAQKPLTEKRPAVRDLLAQQSVLLIVDNFETITDHDIADFVVWVPSGVKVLLTSREEERFLAPIFHRFPPARVTVKGLPNDEALTFLHDEARQQAKHRREGERARLEEVSTAEDVTLLQLVRAVEGNPKALTLALGHIVDNATPLPTLVRDLYAAAESLQRLFDYFFQQAWVRCSEEARALWRIIPFFDAPARRQALAAAAGLQGRFFYDALEELRGRFLLDVEEGRDGEPRYRAHSLVRGAALSYLRDVPDFEAEARQRWITWYVEFAQQYGDDDWDNWADMHKLGEERRNIMNVAQWCYHVGAIDELWSLAIACKQLLQITGYWNERERLFGWAVELARHQHNERIIAEGLAERAWTFHLSFRLDEARLLIEEALALAHTLEDDILIARTVSHLAYVEDYNEQYEKAEQLNTEVETLLFAFPEGRERQRQLIETRYQQGRLAYAQNQPARARQCFQEVFALGEKWHWDRACAYGANWLGDIALDEGNLGEARDWYDRAWEIIRPWGDRRRIAYLHFSESRIALLRGEMARAKELAELALQQFRSLEMRKEAIQTQKWITETVWEERDSSMDGFLI